MAKYTINDTTLTSIADAIRAKGGTSAALTPAQMAEAISAIQAGGGGGYKTGTFTLAEFRALRKNSYVIDHGLNSMPSYIFVYVEEPLALTATRVANEVYAVLASSEYSFCFYQYSNTSYSNQRNKSVAQTWEKDPGASGNNEVSIGYVTENSFSIGASVLSVGLNTRTYRWVAVA